MLPFLVVYKKGDDNDDIQPMMLNVNHNGVNEQKTAKIVNNIYGNPVKIKNNHPPSYELDMQALVHFWDKVSVLCTNVLDDVDLTLTPQYLECYSTPFFYQCV